MRYLPLLLFIWYYSGITMFYHGHLLDGQVIHHSHFYHHDGEGAQPYASHTHPSTVLDIIQKLNNINWSHSFCLFLAAGLASFVLVEGPGAESMSPQSDDDHQKPLRAPPSLAQIL
jgi:hypothetical protein